MARKKPDYSQANTPLLQEYCDDHGLKWAWKNQAQGHKSRPMTIERYTGIDDKRGNPIFEGDIVRWKIGSIKCVGVVAWGTGEWVKGNPGHNMQSLRTYQGSTEIIGNINDNAELLTAPR